ncbi:unnamed protein product [Amoebophrya sp. A120]|nr:unnamed protein product [Amoebophrya sp. A120]|eukprot:GSA120T00012755001.1
MWDRLFGGASSAPSKETPAGGDFAAKIQHLLGGTGGQPPRQFSNGRSPIPAVQAAPGFTPNFLDSVLVPPPAGDNEPPRRSAATATLPQREEDAPLSRSSAISFQPPVMMQPREHSLLRSSRTNPGLTTLVAPAMPRAPPILSTATSLANTGAGATDHLQLRAATTTPIGTRAEPIFASRGFGEEGDDSADHTRSGLPAHITTVSSYSRTPTQAGANSHLRSADRFRGGRSGAAASAPWLGTTESGNDAGGGPLLFYPATRSTSSSTPHQQLLQPQPGKIISSTTTPLFVSNTTTWKNYTAGSISAVSAATPTPLEAETAPLLTQSTRAMSYMRLPSPRKASLSPRKVAPPLSARSARGDHPSIVICEQGSILPETAASKATGCPTPPPASPSLVKFSELSAERNKRRVVAFRVEQKVGNESSSGSCSAASPTSRGANVHRRKDFDFQRESVALSSAVASPTGGGSVVTKMNPVTSTSSPAVHFSVDADEDDSGSVFADGSPASVRQKQRMLAATSTTSSSGNITSSASASSSRRPIAYRSSPQKLVIPGLSPQKTNYHHGFADASCSPPGFERQKDEGEMLKPSGAATGAVTAKVSSQTPAGAAAASTNEKSTQRPQYLKQLDAISRVIPSARKNSPVVRRNKFLSESPPLKKSEPTVREAANKNEARQRQETPAEPEPRVVNKGITTSAGSSSEIEPTAAKFVTRAPSTSSCTSFGEAYRFSRGALLAPTTSSPMKRILSTGRTVSISPTKSADEDNNPSPVVQCTYEGEDSDSESPRVVAISDASQARVLSRVLQAPLLAPKDAVEIPEVDLAEMDLRTVEEDWQEENSLHVADLDVHADDEEEPSAILEDQDHFPAVEEEEMNGTTSREQDIKEEVDHVQKLFEKIEDVLDRVQDQSDSSFNFGKACFAQEDDEVYESGPPSRTEEVVASEVVDRSCKPVELLTKLVESCELTRVRRLGPAELCVPELQPTRAGVLSPPPELEEELEDAIVVGTEVLAQQTAAPGAANQDDDVLPGAGFGAGADSTIVQFENHDPLLSTHVFTRSSPVFAPTSPAFNKQGVFASTSRHSPAAYDAEEGQEQEQNQERTAHELKDHRGVYQEKQLESSTSQVPLLTGSSGRASSSSSKNSKSSVTRRRMRLRVDKLRSPNRRARRASPSLRRKAALDSGIATNSHGKPGKKEKSPVSMRSGWGKPENPFANMEFFSHSAGSPKPSSSLISPSDGSIVCDGNLLPAIPPTPTPQKYEEYDLSARFISSEGPHQSSSDTVIQVREQQIDVAGDVVVREKQQTSAVTSEPGDKSGFYTARTPEEAEAETYFGADALASLEPEIAELFSLAPDASEARVLLEQRPDTPKTISRIPKPSAPVSAEKPPFQRANKYYKPEPGAAVKMQPSAVQLSTNSDLDVVPMASVVSPAVEQRTASASSSYGWISADRHNDELIRSAQDSLSAVMEDVAKPRMVPSKSTEVADAASTKANVQESVATANEITFAEHFGLDPEPAPDAVLGSAGWRSRSVSGDISGKGSKAHSLSTAAGSENATPAVSIEQSNLVARTTTSREEQPIFPQLNYTEPGVSLQDAFAKKFSGHFERSKARAEARAERAAKRAEKEAEEEREKARRAEALRKAQALALKQEAARGRARSMTASGEESAKSQPGGSFSASTSKNGRNSASSTASDQAKKKTAPGSGSTSTRKDHHRGGGGATTRAAAPFAGTTTNGGQKQQATTFLPPSRLATSQSAKEIIGEEENLRNKDVEQQAPTSSKTKPKNKNRYNFFEGLVSASPSEEEISGRPGRLRSQQRKKLGSSTGIVDEEQKCLDEERSSKLSNKKSATSKSSLSVSSSRETTPRVARSASSRAKLSGKPPPPPAFSAKAQIARTNHVTTTAEQEGCRSLSEHVGDEQQPSSSLQQTADRINEKAAPATSGKSAMEFSEKQFLAALKNSPMLQNLTKSGNDDCLLCNKSDVEMGLHFCMDCENKMYEDIKDNFAEKMHLMMNKSNTSKRKAD